MNRYWYCLVGPVEDKVLDKYPHGADFPPRMAVRQTIHQTFGVDPTCASGWLSQREADELEDARYGAQETPAAALRKLVSALDGVKLDTLPEALVKLLPDEKYVNAQQLLTKLYDKSTAQTD